MTLKEQINNIKNNWLILLLVLVVIGFFFVGNTGVTKLAGMNNFGGSYGSPMYDMVEEAAYSKSYRGGYYEDDFAPEIEDRKITKTTSLSTEVERGDFKKSESKLRAIITASDSYLLNENVYKSNSGWKETYHGSYQIKVESSKYSSLIIQLKEIGEIQSFSENAQDITGRYTDVEIELASEKSRLTMFKEMYDNAVDVEDQINLADRIFNLERTIKYYEDQLANLDNRVSYSTISFTMNEERSEWINIAFVKLSQLVRSLVDSINGLLTLLFVLLPWAITIGIIWTIVKVRRR